MATIGVLGLQGAISEHVSQIEAIGQTAVIVKHADQLAEIDGLVLPGGESTTMRKLMDRYDFIEPILQFAKQGKPIFGTCAGMVLLAKKVSGSDNPHLQLIDIEVCRNAFGRQRESFEAAININGLVKEFNAIFIRAPYAENAGVEVEILATYEGKIVVAKQGNILVSAFHPELTDDTRLMQYFNAMVEQTIKTKVEV
ncbi:pyridoxal 5'-phosphate synthase glutaminase subunit PdxT [Bacillus cihuensis]|uniref:pyridoxal 5'-phosphate synthase glutaminase subunit PdxT n=1 Tax=Bacillus cihuensis TaxID=1208599 RepID=UPI000422D52B|nr:pyridoxal 5'-phosphate synthase glutaminase subunit PdxT [Bacillus cihuensis]